MEIELTSNLQLGEHVFEKGDRLRAEIHLLNTGLGEYALTNEDCFLVSEKTEDLKEQNISLASLNVSLNEKNEIQNRLIIFLKAKAKWQEQYITGQEVSK